MGTTVGDIKGDTRSIDYGSYISAGPGTGTPIICIHKHTCRS